MIRYWKAILSDGTTASEGSHKWSDVESDVVALSLHIDGREYSLPKLDGKYFQAKTVSIGMMGGEIKIESRYVGVMTKDFEYCLRVDENDLRCNLEIKKV